MKEERKKQGLKQEDLADLANVSMDTIKRYESGSGYAIGRGIRYRMCAECSAAVYAPAKQK